MLSFELNLRFSLMKKWPRLRRNAIVNSRIQTISRNWWTEKDRNWKIMNRIQLWFLLRLQQYHHAHEHTSTRAHDFNGWCKLLFTVGSGRLLTTWIQCIFSWINHFSLSTDVKYDKLLNLFAAPLLEISFFLYAKVYSWFDTFFLSSFIF